MTAKVSAAHWGGRSWWVGQGRPQLAHGAFKTLDTGACGQPERHQVDTLWTRRREAVAGSRWVACTCPPAHGLGGAAFGVEVILARRPQGMSRSLDAPGCASHKCPRHVVCAPQKGLVVALAW